MQIIIIPKDINVVNSNGKHLLRFAFSSEPVASVIIYGLNRCLYIRNGQRPHSDYNGNFIYAIPEEWQIKQLTTAGEIITYTDNIPIYPGFQRITKLNRWSTFSNGRFVTQFNKSLLDKILTETQADVLAVNAEPELLAYHEKVRLTTQNKIAGIRRCHSDSAESASFPEDWPHHVFLKSDALNQIIDRDVLPVSFAAFAERCRRCNLTLHAINVAGVAHDLETEEGLLNFCRTEISKIWNSNFTVQNSNTAVQDSKIVGKVLLGKNIKIGSNVILVGPTIVGDNTIIEDGAVINSSIIGPNVTVPSNQFVQNNVVGTFNGGTKFSARSVSYKSLDFDGQHLSNDNFRHWSRFSYVRSLKRIADCTAAIIVLILFAPITPFIALAIKLTSRGAVLFKDRRQGLHGKGFYCLKFRSMTVGADNIQDKLKAVSQVDGPQFKMKDDPRLTAVGRFLRDTCIDEIPQFINVLLGQMSVVGPRPSPKSENTLCPYWRDARLSVRPGITGLWQIQRTRQPLKDFQEWIHYDTEYVKNLSLRLDLWICWQTTKKLLKDFINQF
jgi:lipopolysaccharide/colanic/teichoic acid biosynthesis glycosyltransferase